LIYKDEGKAQINQEHSIFKRTIDTSAIQSVEQRLKDGTKLYQEFCRILTNYQWNNYNTAEELAVNDSRKNNLSVTFFSTPLKYPLKDSEQVCNRLKGRRPEISDLAHYNTARTFPSTKGIKMWDQIQRQKQKV